MRSLPYFLISVAAALGVCGLIWFTEIPLGIPGEWAWDRIHPPQDWLLTLVRAGITGLVYFGFVSWGARRIERSRQPETALWLAGLTAAGFCWLWIAQDSAPTGYRFSKTAWVLFYPGSSGYFTVARDHDADFDAFLQDYEKLMAQGDVLHVGTHPPGLVVGYHGLIELCRASPGLVEGLRASEPESLSDAFEIIARNHRGTPSALLAEHRAALWLAALLTQLTAAAAVIPLYLMIRRDFSSETAWLAAALWATVPALALFLPKSDVLYPLCGLLFFYWWLSGWEQRSVLRSFGAGIILLIGLSCSLALIPVALCVAGVTIWRGWLCRPEEQTSGAWSNLWFSLLWAGVGFLMPLAALWWLKGVNLCSIWIWNYHNHAGFYDEYARTYWKWLLVNPLEFCIAAGPALAIAALCGVWKTGIAAPRSRRAGTYWSCLLVCGLLWLSGKNMGELARLWIVLMPWLVLLSAGSFEMEPEDRSSLIPRSWIIALTLQMATVIAMVMRVHGFHIPELPQ